MFSPVSWPDFVLFLFILLLIYYSCIGLIYFRRELTQFFLHGHKSFQETPVQKPETGNRLETGPFNKKTKTPLDVFKEELGEYFHGCAQLKPTREEFLLGLGAMIQRSEYIPGTREKIPLHQFIIESSQTICSIALSNAEVDRLWKN